ncbi:hypothetical protein C0585_07925 [Candidatus Woesearchaeota archaeon]|nr:MAG: hypothetical protein C0585_07925 [Candidatus Woesearchaeota archaeon]
MKKLYLILVLSLFLVAISGCDTITGDAKKIKVITECNDGIDNDGDGLIDFEGLYEGRGRNMVLVAEADSNCESETGDSEASVIVCKDTDGDDYYTKGTMVTYADDIKIGGGDDKCRDATTLLEFICETPDSVGHSIDYVCPNGCVDGVCVETINESLCTDSDGGINAEVFGTIKGYGFIGTITENDIIQLQDKCWVIDGVNKGIVEYYCDGDRIAKKEASCDSLMDGTGYACDSGVCKFDPESCFTDGLMIECPEGYFINESCKCENSITFCNNTDDGVVTNLDSYNDYCLSDTEYVTFACNSGSSTGVAMSHNVCPDGYMCKDATCVVGDTDGEIINDTWENQPIEDEYSYVIYNMTMDHTEFYNNHSVTSYNVSSNLAVIGVDSEIEVFYLYDVKELGGVSVSLIDLFPIDNLGKEYVAMIGLK